LVVVGGFCAQLFFGLFFKFFFLFGLVFGVCLVVVVVVEAFFHLADPQATQA